MEYRFNESDFLEVLDSSIAVSLGKPYINDKSNYKDIFYKVFNISPILMAISTIESGVFVDVNQAWLDTLGYRKEEVVYLAIERCINRQLFYVESNCQL